MRSDMMIVTAYEPLRIHLKITIEQHCMQDE